MFSQLSSLQDEVKRWSLPAPPSPQDMKTPLENYQKADMCSLLQIRITFSRSHLDDKSQQMQVSQVFAPLVSRTTTLCACPGCN
ncbi:hypothetical protein GDO78_014681 [Eleutherodactylus coqui]|uniref:Uncharacterized protein n=1 Tax=Eleutherodactylus coqui TaxID=57060 RepID=A0A8J6BL48_ELECQ|nr:hypothetical protein GDO78_014681 [Eleutherodactylus coqui]